MTLASHIFRQYDIRGIVGTDLDASVARSVGQAYASLIRAEVDGTPTVVVGHDNRPSSPALVNALMEGLNAGGVDVVDIGCVPTPMVYWAEKTLGTDGGIQVTGSHNPAEYNGIKMTSGTRSLYGDRIQELKARIESGDLVTGAGSVRKQDIYPAYIGDISGRIVLDRPLKVAVDCGNGTGALLAVELMEAVGIEVTPLYCESDGTFPNHHPDPTVDENLVELIRAVTDGGLDLGIGFDGDADRVGVVDDKGRIVRGDILTLLFGLDILKRRGPGQKLIYDVKCSQALHDVYEAAGGIPIMWMTGHSLMKEKMREEGALLAGELSGHICIADDYLGFDDALYDAVRLARLVAAADEPLSAMVDRFPSYVSTPEIRIDVTEEQKWGVVEKATAHFKQTHDVIDVDGARVQFGDGWGLLRASNTQPVIVARFEATTQDRLDEIQAEVLGWLRSQGVDA